MSLKPQLSPVKTKPHDSPDASPPRDRGAGGAGNVGIRRASTILFPSAAVGVRAGSPSIMHRAGSPGLLNTESGSLDKVKKNPKGGILVTPEEISTAFSMLDVERSGQLTLNSLKKRLGVLFPEMTAKEYRFLMNNKKELTMDDLKELLIENELSGFDPIVDAFRVFDPDGKGMLNEDKLRKAFVSFGFGELSDEELEILKRTADLDGDGIVSLEDFRGMIDNQPATRKNISINK